MEMNLRSAITVTGMLFNFLNGGELPHEKYHFYQNAGEGGEVVSAVCQEHVHTSGPHTRINNSVFKKSNVLSFQLKKNRKN